MEDSFKNHTPRQRTKGDKWSENLLTFHWTRHQNRKPVIVPRPARPGGRQERPALIRSKQTCHKVSQCIDRNCHHSRTWRSRSPGNFRFSNHAHDTYNNHTNLRSSVVESRALKPTYPVVLASGRSTQETNRQVSWNTPWNVVSSPGRERRGREVGNARAAPGQGRELPGITFL